MFSVVVINCAHSQKVKRIDKKSAFFVLKNLFATDDVQNVMIVAWDIIPSLNFCIHTSLNMTES